MPFEIQQSINKNIKSKTASQALSNMKADLKEDFPAAVRLLGGANPQPDTGRVLVDETTDGNEAAGVRLLVKTLTNKRKYARESSVSDIPDVGALVQELLSQGFSDLTDDK
ncbi:hypothetical protein FOZ61_005660, partial [Perkinsus olseni]